MDYDMKQIDFALLRRQKATLNLAIGSKESQLETLSSESDEHAVLLERIADLHGILHLIDDLQDTAVRYIGEQSVFGLGAVANSPIKLSE